MNYGKIIGESIGRRVFLKRKSNSNYTVVGTIEDYDDELKKFYVVSEKDKYMVDIEDILSLDIKSVS